MNSNKLIITVVAVVVVIAAIAGVVRYSQQGWPQRAAPGQNTNTPASPAPGTPENAAGTGSGTRSQVIGDVKVPGAGEKNVATNIAVPVNVMPALPGSERSIRSYEIKAEGNKFTPDTVIVNVGDTMEIKITAVDKDYDFVQPDYGLKESIAKGKTGKINFDATASGKFMFYCATCGGPAAGPVGYVVVPPKK